MESPIYCLLAFYLIANTFAFRYQRTTLSICRSIGEVHANIQAAMTPPWLGLLGWIDTGLLILLPFLLFFQFGLISAFGFLAYAFVGTAAVDSVTPLPTYRQCFRIIMRFLESDISRSPEPERTRRRILLIQVEAVGNDYGLIAKMEP
jgi:hypothetical protein